jgi:hypothetical protein
VELNGTSRNETGTVTIEKYDPPLAVQSLPPPFMPPLIVTLQADGTFKITGGFDQEAVIESREPSSQVPLNDVHQQQDVLHGRAQGPQPLPKEVLNGERRELDHLQDTPRGPAPFG